MCGLALAVATGTAQETQQTKEKKNSAPTRQVHHAQLKMATSQHNPAGLRDQLRLGKSVKQKELQDQRKRTNNKKVR
jgi:hypothetical protein